MCSMRTVGLLGDCSFVLTKCLQTDAAVRSKMEGTNIDPFLHRPTISRGRCRITRILMLFLPYHAY